MQEDGLSHVVMNVDVNRMDDSVKDASTPEARKKASDAIKAAIETKRAPPAPAEVVRKPRKLRAKKAGDEGRSDDAAPSVETADGQAKSSTHVQQANAEEKETPQAVPETAKPGDT